MENWLYANTTLLIKAIITILVIFIVMIVITRISGLRTFAKMSSFDFASTIAIGSILASVIMNSNQSLLKGIFALGGIVAFQTFFSFLVRKSKAFRNFSTNNPMMLMYQGKIFPENLAKTNVSQDDLIAKLREANVIDFKEVLAVVLESTGDMSVIHSAEKSEIPEKLLLGVEGIPENATFIKPS